MARVRLAAAGAADREVALGGLRGLSVGACCVCLLGECGRMCALCVLRVLRVHVGVVLCKFVLRDCVFESGGSLRSQACDWPGGRTFFLDES